MNPEKYCICDGNKNFGNFDKCLVCRLPSYSVWCEMNKPKMFVKKPSDDEIDNDYYKGKRLSKDYIFKPDDGIKSIENNDIVYNFNNERIGIIKIKNILEEIKQPSYLTESEEEENAEYTKRAMEWIFFNGKLTGAEGKEFIKYIFNN